jgi:hypothetical protein
VRQPVTIPGLERGFRLEPLGLPSQDYGPSSGLCWPGQGELLGGVNAGAMTKPGAGTNGAAANKHPVRNRLTLRCLRPADREIEQVAEVCFTPPP